MERTGSQERVQIKSVSEISSHQILDPDTPLLGQLASFLTRIAASSGVMPNEWPQRPPLYLQLEWAMPPLEPQDSGF